MAADFGLSSFLEDVPQINLGDIIPSSPFLPSEPRHEPIIVNAPRAQAALQNKYSGYMRDLTTQYPPELINALMDYDARRVRSGQSPLSENETRTVLATAATREAATPEPKRKIGPTGILANAIKDIGSIVTSLPQLPFMLAHEATQIGTLGPGSNPLAQLANAPGIRLLPGTYTAGNILGGTPGELLRHPVFTFLDVLPIAHQVAKGAPVVRTVSGLAETARTVGEHAGLTTRQFTTLDRLADRPISTAINWKIGEGGLPVRSARGQFIDNLKRSKLGSFMATNFGREVRDLNFGVQQPIADANVMLDGKRPPETPLEAITKAAHDVHTNVSAIDPQLATAQSMADLYDHMTGLKPIENLTDNQAAAIQVYTEALSNLSEWALENSKNIRFRNEMYDNATGLLLLQRQRNLTERKTFNAVRRAVLESDPTSALGVLAKRLHSPMRPAGTYGTRMSMIERARSIQAGAAAPREILTTWRATNQSLKNAGYDTRILEEMVGKSAVNLHSAAFRQAIDDVIAGKLELPTTPTMTPTQVMEYAEARVRGGSIGFRDVIQGVHRREWKGVTDALDNLRKEDPAFIRGVRNMRDTDRLLGHASLRSATDEGVVLAQRAFDRAQRENLPARFLPKQQQIMRDIVAQELIKQQDLLPITERTPVEDILHAADAGDLTEIAGFTDEILAQARKEASKKIEEMRANGFNPTFVHTVPVNRVKQSFRFTERIEPHTPASMRKRMNDLTPGIKNFAIAINDQAMQFLQEPLHEARLHWVEDNFGYHPHEVSAMVHEEARYRAGRNPAKSYEGHKVDVINERFKALDPDELNMFWGSPYINKLRTDKVYVPIEIARNLKQLSSPERFFGGLMDPVTKTFRIATTALSLRTQIYNIVGGGVATTLMNPMALVQYGSEARRLMRNPTELPREFQSVVGSSKRTLMELDDESKGIVIEGVRKYLLGKRERQWWDAMQERRKTHPGPFTTLGNKVKGLVEKSYEFNSFFDDFYRTTTYLAEYEKQIGKGYAEDFARYKAVGASRKVLQDYLGMTPFERNIVKSLIPFYGFLSHAARFVLRYPFDHPLRTEFLAKIAMAEMEQDDVLPNRFLSMLFYGRPDAKGAQHALNLGPFNPFGDVANSMTLAGFLGNTNPILQTAFEMVGLDRGQAELYPSLRYNPDTGRMEATRRGFLETAVQNIVPQSGLILSMIGMNSQYNEMLQRDPDSAARYMLSTMTVPILERQINVPQEIFAAELARQKSATSALNAGLKSGNWSEAMLYPSLQAYLDAVESLPEEQLAPFREIAKEDLAELAAQAMSGQPLPERETMTLDDIVAAYASTAVPNLPGVNALSGLATAGPLGLNGI